MKLFIILVAQFLFAVIVAHAVAGTQTPTASPTTCSTPLINIDDCRPSYMTTEAQCRDRIRRCYISYGIELKWTGPGSPHINGQAQGDGGCQCKEYCGYFTKRPCNRDHRCIWAFAKGVCYHRQPNYPGFPIETCPCQWCCGNVTPGRRVEELLDTDNVELQASDETANGEGID